MHVTNIHFASATPHATVIIFDKLSILEKGNEHKTRRSNFCGIKSFIEENIKAIFSEWLH